MQQGFVLDRVQRQSLSQRQMLAVQLMPLPSGALREHILFLAKENPAVFLPDDWNDEEPERYPIPAEPHHFPFFGERYTALSGAGSAASDAHQSMLEQVAGSVTLQQHLLDQVDLLRKPPDILRACKIIIDNLDPHGFNTVPIKELPGLENNEIRDKALFIVQNLDPEGLACNTVWESLAFQALHSSAVMPLYTDRVLLQYHDLLKRRRPDLLARNLAKHGINITKKHAQSILSFIASLNPNPAAAFGAQHIYVEPDVYVEVSGSDVSVRLAKLHQTDISIDQEYAEKIADTNLSAKEKVQIRTNLKKAQLLVESLSMAHTSLLKIAAAVVSVQSQFFCEPGGALRAVTQRMIAEKTALSESTVSRIVSDKYLMSPRGFMPLRALFSVPAAAPGKAVLSRDEVQREIRTIVSASSEMISDRRIAELLEERGITIARRTVAKYRALMNMGSSFDLTR